MIGLGLAITMPSVMASQRKNVTFNIDSGKSTRRQRPGGSGHGGMSWKMKNMMDPAVRQREEENRRFYPDGDGGIESAYAEFKDIPWGQDYLENDAKIGKHAKNYLILQEQLIQQGLKSKEHLKENPDLCYCLLAYLRCRHDGIGKDGENRDGRERWLELATKKMERIIKILEESRPIAIEERDLVIAFPIMDRLVDVIRYRSVCKTEVKLARSGKRNKLVISRCDRLISMKDKETAFFDKLQKSYKTVVEKLNLGDQIRCDHEELCQEIDQANRLNSTRSSGCFSGFGLPTSNRSDDSPYGDFGLPGDLTRSTSSGGLGLGFETTPSASSNADFEGGYEVQYEETPRTDQGRQAVQAPQRRVTDWLLLKPKTATRLLRRNHSDPRILQATGF